MVLQAMDIQGEREKEREKLRGEDRSRKKVPRSSLIMSSM
jgi:hypothetical protein